MGRTLTHLAFWCSLTLMLVSCKSTDDYLIDLATLDPTPVSGREFLKEKSIVFDAGQLAHEAFAGLTTAEEMKFWQAIASLSHACNFLGTAKDRALLQADAAILIGIILSRMPIPPVDDQLISIEKDPEGVVGALEKLLAAREALRTEGMILALDSPDEVQKLEAIQDLKKKTNQDFGDNAEEWAAWFEGQKAQIIEQFIAESQGPLEYLTKVRWDKGVVVRPILKFFAIWIRQYAQPELEPYYVPCVLNIARQAAVLTLTESMLRDRNGTVRADVAEAMKMVLDPVFGEALISQLPLERNPYAASKMIHALAAYPSRKTVENLITAMAKEDPLISQNAADVLKELTKVDFATDRDAWTEWWLKTGVELWP